MNELLKSCGPVVKTKDLKCKAMLETWKQYILEYDVEDHNKWSSQLSEDGLDIFFYKYPYNPTRRDLVVIASILSWLPSNCGRCFLEDAEKLSTIHNSRIKGYLYAWAEENQRVTYINNGYTCIEYLLTPIEEHDFHGGLNCTANYFITIHDIECSNYFINWLSTNDGQTFLSIAKDKLSRMPNILHI